MIIFNAAEAVTVLSLDNHVKNCAGVTVLLTKQLVPLWNLIPTCKKISRLGLTYGVTYMYGEQTWTLHVSGPSILRCIQWRQNLFKIVKRIRSSKITRNTTMFSSNYSCMVLYNMCLAKACYLHVSWDEDRRPTLATPDTNWLARSCSYYVQSFFMLWIRSLEV